MIAARHDDERPQAVAKADAAVAAHALRWKAALEINGTDRRVMKWFLILGPYACRGTVIDPGGFDSGISIEPPKPVTFDPRGSPMPSLAACLTGRKKHPGSECVGVQIDEK